jgi:pimeloyl-ACP methyl ester carboxylesterase
MRGYGQTDVPAANTRTLSGYNVQTLAQDVVSIASALGHDRFVVVGHDFGSWLAWRVAILHPDRVLAVCGMSVPFVGLDSPKYYGPLEQLQRRYGRCLDTSASDEEMRNAKFHYMLHHCLNGAAEEYDKNVEEALFRLLCYHPGVDCFDNTPEVTDKRMFPPQQQRSENKCNVTFDASSAPGWWKRLPRPVKLPPWLSQSDMDFYVSEFKRAGFAGGLKWYRALDINWKQLRHFGDGKIHPPALFIAGNEDGVIQAHGGEEFVRKRMQERCDTLANVVMLEGAGHWIQQERAYDVNICLLKFLDEFVPNYMYGNERFQQSRSTCRSKL